MFAPVETLFANWQLTLQLRGKLAAAEQIDGFFFLLAKQMELRVAH